MPLKKPLLTGVTVADFGWAVAGPIFGHFLAHLGATVVKVESKTRLDRTRAAPPFFGKPSRNRSAIFDHHNAGKQSVTLNLKHPVGAEIAQRFALWADVVNENFRPGVMSDLGLDYATLRSKRADIIMVSASMQGQTGPHAGHPGLGVTLQGIVGLCHLTGWPDRDPVGPGTPYTDTLAPWVAGVALMAVLDHRRRTGNGAHIDISQLEATAEFLAPALIHEQMTGIAHDRRGNDSPARAPEGAYPCLGTDRWCAISICDDSQWSSLKQIIGFTSSDSIRGEPLDWRLANREAIDEAVSHWTSTRTTTEVQELLQSHGIAAYVVATGQDIFEDKQLAARGHFVARDHPTMGEHLYESPPYRLSEHEVVVERAPLLGEHTDEILASCLGMSQREIDEAREAGALD